MTTRFIGIVGATACLLMLFVALLQAEKGDQPEKSSCETLLVTKCGTCHYLTRVCQKIGRKSKGDWRRNVKRMVRKGAVLSRDEQKVLVDCLHKEEEGAVKACQDYR
ncbi:MAG: hypothetical protein H8E41_13220 [Desulfobulbaceae bacterium]|uniref:Quinohemoprotein amine dehydrogenase alpha subunit haem binding domain-containing protein n=1 Tax=Candidatus Desulfobia pelagia TaxID=2841692 RepID=A0A8J6NHS4_9BACT|nr:hypothetical protein [Candidatus Desulfobia pelagia]